MRSITPRSPSRAEPRRLLPAFLAAVLLLLPACGEREPMSDEEIEQIAHKTSEYLKPVVKEMVDKQTADLRRDLGRPDRGGERPAPAPTIAAPNIRVADATGGVPAPGLAPPASTPPSPEAAVVAASGAAADQTLASIGGEALTMADLQRLREQDSRLAKRDPKLLLNDLIRFRLMAKAAADSGLPDADPELKVVVEDRKADFRHELMVRDAMASLPAVGEADLKDFLESHLDDFIEREKMKTWEIAVGTKDEAEAILKDLKKENFEETARKRSSGNTARSGGSLGEISKERLTKEAWDALVGAAEGQIVGPFVSPVGLWHIFLRGTYTPEKRPELPAIRARVQAALEVQRHDKASKELSDKARAIWPVKIEMPDPAKGGKDDQVLFHMGAQGVTLGEFVLAFKSLDPRRAQIYQGEEGQRRFLDTLVDRYLVSNLAKTDPGFQARHEDHVRDVERQLVINAFTEKSVFKGINVADDVVKARYEKEKDTTFKTPPQRSIKASHILFRVDENAAEDKVAAAREKALAALARIKGGEDFAAVARVAGDPDDPTTAKGGALDPFGPGMTVPPFEAAVTSLAPWQVTSAPVRSKFGLHLVRREPTEPSVPLAMVQDFLRQRLTEEAQRQAIESFLDGLTKKYAVKTWPDRLPAPPAPPTPAATATAAGAPGATGKAPTGGSVPSADGRGDGPGKTGP